MSNNLKLGDWNAVCDRCGFEFKASELRKTWDNLYVCKDDWEQRHPSDFFRGRSENTSVPWSRPEGTDAAGTDIEGNNTGFIGNTTSNGDVDKILTMDVDAQTQVWDTALTSDRKVSLDTTNAQSGDIFKIYRTAGGSPLHILQGVDRQELVTNGSFDGETGWTKDADWTIAGGTASIDGSQASTSDLYQTNVLASGQSGIYVIQVTVTNYAAGQLTVFFSNGTQFGITANGSYTFYSNVGGAGTGSLFFRANDSFDGTVDSVSAKASHNLVINGTFPWSSADWTATNSTLSVSSEQLVVTGTGAAAARATQELSTTGGSSYVLQYDCFDGTDTDGQITVGTSQGGYDITFDNTVTASTDNFITFDAVNNSTWIGLGVNAGVATSDSFKYDNVFCYEVIQTIQEDINAVITVEYNGSTWQLKDYTTLGL